MTTPPDARPGAADDDRPDPLLDRLLALPLLQVPDGFDRRVLAALPPVDAVPPQSAITGWRQRLQAGVLALVMAVCGALGAAEVLLFASGLVTATAVSGG